MRWEYRVLSIVGSAADKPGVQKMLNEHGALGWEIVSVVCQFNVHSIYMKRPLKMRDE